ncbi:hypothetical protein Q1695_003560 [Nippostrongylus brasiliensis]|nr:hypothetical protein Q1695_003560 [Nippostrongylus brasiliensis]
MASLFWTISASSRLVSASSFLVSVRASIMIWTYGGTSSVGITRKRSIAEPALLVEAGDDDTRDRLAGTEEDRKGEENMTNSNWNLRCLIDTRHGRCDQSVDNSSIANQNKYTGKGGAM